MNNSQELAAEQQRMKVLRTIVDMTAAVLRQGNLSVPEAITLVKATKQAVLKLFPDKEEVYDLIYGPRFERIIQENLEEN